MGKENKLSQCHFGWYIEWWSGKHPNLSCHQCYWSRPSYRGTKLLLTLILHIASTLINEDIRVDILLNNVNTIVKIHQMVKSIITGNWRFICTIIINLPDLASLPITRFSLWKSGYGREAGYGKLIMMWHIKQQGPIVLYLNLFYYFIYRHFIVSSLILSVNLITYT